MSNEKKQILEMLSQGKISVQEAENLLAALGEKPNDNGGSVSAKEAKFLRINVETKEEDGDRVNIKIPIKFIKAGLKLTAFIPDSAYKHVNHALEENGIPLDLRNMKDADFTDLIEALQEMEINVQSKEGEKVRIFCEYN